MFVHFNLSTAVKYGFWEVLGFNLSPAVTTEKCDAFDF